MAVAYNESFIRVEGPRPAKPTMGMPTAGVMSERAIPISIAFAIVPLFHLKLKPESTEDRTAGSDL